MTTDRRAPIADPVPTSDHHATPAAHAAGWAGIVLLAAAGTFAFVSQAQVPSGDLSQFLLPWHDHLLQHGGFAGLATVPSDYPPAYLYLIALATLVDRSVGPIVAIKLISIIFDGVAAWLFFRIALATGRKRQTAWLVAALCFVLPSVVIDSALMGQCDIIYTVFLLAFVLSMMRQRPAAAMLCLGLAFAFKLQTVFIAAYVAVLLLRGSLRWLSLAVVLLVYAAAAIPILIAGRSIHSVLAVYLYQAHRYWTLSMGAANPYLLLDNISPLGGGWPMTLALAIAALLMLALVVAASLRSSVITMAAAPGDDLLLSTTSLVFVPYVLPAMHDRYFFPAGVFGVALAVARPKLWPIALMLQISDTLVYLVVLYLPTWSRLTYVGLLATTLALVLLLRALGPISLTASSFRQALRSFIVPWPQRRSRS